MSIKILVVDDSASDRLMIRKMLAGYPILEATNGQEAMKILEEEDHVDLLLLDLNMPGMDGFAVMEALSGGIRHERMRTIILTNHDEIDKEIQGLSSGAIDYIRKPIHMKSLEARIKIHADMLLLQRQMEENLRIKEATFEQVFQQAPIGIAISYETDSVKLGQYHAIRINRMFEKITGRSKEDLIKYGWSHITHPDDLEKDLSQFKQLMSGQIKGYAMEKRYIRPDGSFVWVHMVVSLLALSEGDELNHICLIQDITERKNMEVSLAESERSKTVLLSHLPGMAYRCAFDREWTMHYVSEGCLELTGYSAQDLMHNRTISYNRLIAQEYRQDLWEKLQAAVTKDQAFDYEYEILTRGGQRKWVMERGQAIWGSQGEVEALEGIILDISDRKMIENQLRYNSEHDAWTGLPNRGSLESLLARDMMRSDGIKRALVVVNLSEVHVLSSLYGFNYAQDLLKKTAEMLREFASEKRQLFKTFENRFSFYLREYGDQTSLASFCETLAQSLDFFLAAEGLGGGIGVLELDMHRLISPDTALKRLLATSEIALELHDRDFGICYYNDVIERKIQREEDIKYELDLVAAGEGGARFFLHFQPILDLNSGRVCCFEGLARLESDKLGLVSPLEFIPIAEKTKLIIPLGQLVLEKALDFLDKLEGEGFGNIKVSINVSAIQLLRKDFATHLMETIAQRGVRPECITLEITESVLVPNFEEVNQILGQLRAFGILVAIDDFGTGYSSLERERELNINSLKIDKSFIDKLSFQSNEEAITSDIISMAHKMGHKVVAEGVEDLRQLDNLIKSGCDKVQGYLISRPLNEGPALAFLREENILEIIFKREKGGKL